MCSVEQILTWMLFETVSYIPDILKIFFHTKRDPVSICGFGQVCICTISTWSGRIWMFKPFLHVESFFLLSVTSLSVKVLKLTQVGAMLEARLSKLVVCDNTYTSRLAPISNPICVYNVPPKHKNADACILAELLHNVSTYPLHNCRSAPWRTSTPSWESLV